MRIPGTLRRNMVDSQLRTNMVTDRRLLAAMADIPRERFVSGNHRFLAYGDGDIPLGSGRALVAPTVFARLVQALEITGDDVVLDIACGTGYSSIILGRLAQAVVALDSDAAHIQRAAEIQTEFNPDNVIFELGPLAEGRKEEAPFDVIHVNGAVGCLPETLLGQLAPGGRLGVVVRPDNGQGRAELVTRSGGVVSRRSLFDANVSMLAEFSHEKGFTF